MKGIMKRTLLIALILAVSLPIFSLAEEQDTSSTALIENALALDGQTVTYTGELIGDIMKRGDYAWVNLSDGSNAIGVWVQSNQLGDITCPGRYGVSGDIVRISGVFHRACREHGGDLDIHAQQVSLVAKGHNVSHPVSPVRLVLTLVFTAMCAVVLIRLLQRRKKRL